VSQADDPEVSSMSLAVDRSQIGDDFLRQYSLHQKQIYSFIGAFLRSGADIDEVLQETSVILWSKYHEFRPDGDFLRWACGIARLEVYRFCRSRKGVTMPFDDRLFETLAEDRELLNEHLDQRRSALSHCLQKLKRRDRELIEACYQANTTAKGVAERLCRPVNAVYQSLSRIRRLLYECVTRALASQNVE
jgi:RNA polymerase sigma-70 factor, ECF subfamily